jgi:hypothetical protein
MKEEFPLESMNNFIKHCDGVIEVSISDIIQWKPHYKKELWEQNSFLFNNTFKLGEKHWYENIERIHQLEYKCRASLEHLIKVDGNIKVGNYAKNKLDAFWNKLVNFKKENNLGHVDVMTKNQWFFEYYSLIRDFYHWFNYLISLSPEDRIEIFYEKGIRNGLIEHSKSEIAKSYDVNLLKINFDKWLNVTKGFNTGDIEKYNELITESVFFEYLKKIRLDKLKLESDIKVLEIATELIGTNDLYSQVIKVGHIKTILSNRNLTPSEAIDLLEDIGKNAYSPSFYNKVVSEIIEHLERMMARPKNNNSADEVKEDDITNKPWFIVGMSFASGEIYRHYEESQQCLRKTAKALHNVNLRQIISNTLFHDDKQYGEKNSRNIFLSMEKMTTIINRCKENGITIDERFMANYNTLQSKS